LFTLHTTDTHFEVGTRSFKRKETTTIAAKKNAKRRRKKKKPPVSNDELPLDAAARSRIRPRSGRRTPTKPYFSTARSSLSGLAY
jgi:hypothetical protein